MSDKKLTLYQKLLEIQKEILGLGKDKKSFGYDYTTGGKVLEHIKPLMNKHKLLLKQEVIEFTNERQDYTTKNGSKSEILTKVSMKFTWVDTESGEKDENLWGANGQNDWEKGFGSALTYGERYFLLKYFHISTDSDDIDNPDRKTSTPIKKPSSDKKITPPRRLNAKQIAAIPNTDSLESLETALKDFALSDSQKQMIEKRIKELS